MDARNSVALYSLRRRNNALSVSNNTSAIEARGGFPPFFATARSAALRRSPQFYEVCARSDAAHRRAETTHACPAVAPHGIGSAVVALIFSMAKREVTFLSGTAAISRL